ncbi:MAG TPA: FUSC family protein [Terracidiphilus sp.]|nr:FUSC family protein [Terracidiphilus sp.]
MRFPTNKTWSQQQLAKKLHVEQPGRAGWLSWERRRLMIHAAKTALAAGLCWWLALRFGLHDGYWGAISAIIVLQSNVGSTVTASRDRLLGTLIGALFGFSFSLFGSLPWNYVLALVAAMAICGLLGLRSSSRLAGVTITIVMLVQNATSHWTIALDRVGQVILGIIVALLVSTFVLPDRARLRLRDGLAEEFLVLGTFFEAILQGFGGSPPDGLAAKREEALTRLRDNNALLDAARNEPSGGAGWREGPSMLAQFGRSIFDALVALEFAVRDSHEDKYVEQLEPALGRLVMDIHTGFHYVAGCIHHWRFHVPPPGINIEEDIAQLEARMAEVRHTGSQFSQAEILRAYAVQLHLKQIARLLRSARVETGRAVGVAPKQESDPT